jgi:hypothetical protein
VSRQTPVPLDHVTLSPSFRVARELVQLVDSGDLLLDPPYQRGRVWSLDQKIALIRSWLTGVPTGVIILSDRSGRKWAETNGDVYEKGGAVWACVDGQQRITAAREWFADGFAVPASWFDPERVETTEEGDDGPYVRYSGLSVTGQRMMSNSRALLSVAEFRTAATVADEAEIYLLVNGGGTPQTDADMANATRVAKEEK